MLAGIREGRMMITFEQAMENALAVYVREWFDSHPDMLMAAEPEQASV